MNLPHWLYLIAWEVETIQLREVVLYQVLWSFWREELCAKKILLLLDVKTGFLIFEALGREVEPISNSVVKELTAL